MATNFDALMASPERRRAMHVAYSLEMLGDIATNYDGAVDRGEFSCARCMIDAFYVHVRLLADFLVKATSDRDFGPEDFGVQWTSPTTPEALRLGEYWGQASRYVVHFGRPRVPEDLQDLESFRIGGQSFRTMARDALTVFAEFLDRLESEAARWTMGALIPDPNTDPDGWSLRIKADQASLLRDAFNSAGNALELKRVP